MKQLIFSLGLLLTSCLLSIAHVAAQPWTAQASQMGNDLYALALGNSQSLWAFGKADHGTSAPIFQGSLDQGQTWQPQGLGLPDAEFFAAQAIDSLRVIAAGRQDIGLEAGIFALSLDGGQNWQIDQLTFSVPLLALYFADSLHGWVAGHRGYVAKTIDGGRSWQTLLTSASRDLHAVHFQDSLHGIVAGENGTLLTTSDGGINWSTVSTGQSRDFYALSASDSTTIWVAGGQGTLMVTTDGGQSWENRNAPTSRDLLCLDFASPTKGWAAGENGSLIFTQDGGDTWALQSSGTSRNIQDLTMWSDQLGWFCGEKGVIYIYQEQTSPVDEFGLNPHIRLYPTLLGRDHRLWIDNGRNQAITLELYDLNGRQVMPATIFLPGTSYLEVSQIHAGPGMYLVNVHQKEKVIFRQKIILW